MFHVSATFKDITPEDDPMQHHPPELPMLNPKSASRTNSNEGTDARFKDIAKVLDEGFVTPAKFVRRPAQPAESPRIFSTEIRNEPW